MHIKMLKVNTDHKIKKYFRVALTMNNEVRFLKGECTNGE